MTWSDHLFLFNLSLFHFMLFYSVSILHLVFIVCQYFQRIRNEILLIGWETKSKLPAAQKKVIINYRLKYVRLKILFNADLRGAWKAYTFILNGC